MTSLLEYIRLKFEDIYLIIKRVSLYIAEKHKYDKSDVVDINHHFTLLTLGQKKLMKRMRAKVPIWNSVKSRKIA